MSLSDRFRSIIPKKTSPEKPVKKTPPTPPPEPRANESVPVESKAARTGRDIELQIAQEKTEAEAHIEALSKEIKAIQLKLEKSSLDHDTQRESHLQTMQFLQQDAERELRFLERKLQEDSAVWTRQLSEREKHLEQSTKQEETTSAQKKKAFEKDE